MKAVDALDTIPLFNLVKGEERRRLATELTEARYHKGQAIFQEGDPTEYFHVLKEGCVKCVKTSPEGKELTLKILMPGDLFCCEAAVFDGVAHPGCARPLGDVSILRLSKTAYFDMLRRNPDAALEVIKYLGKRLHEAQEQAKTLAMERAEPRLAALLVSLAGRAGVRRGNRIDLTVRLTRQDLADMAAMTVETAIRIMSRFKRLGIVSGTAKRLVINDLPGLESLATATPPPPLPRLCSGA